MNAALTDTLHVKVTDLRYPVTEDVVRSVFGPIAPPTQVHMLHNVPKGTAIAIVRFADPRAADACRQQRDNRCIYNECNRMEIAFTHWDSFVPQAVLASPPPVVVTGPYDPANAYGYDGGRGGRGGRGRGRGGFDPMAQPMPGQGMPGQAPFMMQAVPPQMMQGQPQPYGMSPQPYAGYGMPQQPIVGGVAIGRGGFGSRGGGGMAMSGRGGIHIPAPTGGVVPGPGMMPPMGMAGQFNPAAAAAALMGMNPAMMMAFMQAQQAQQQQQQRVPNPFLSVAMMDKDIPLLPLYALCEVWGQVVYIRRNFTKPNILTVKYTSPNEAQLASLCLKKAPFFGSLISGRNFEKFVEKNADPTEEGDPNDASVLAYNFTNFRHRLNSSRAKWGPSEALRIWNFQNPVTAEDIHAYYEGLLGSAPTEVSGQEDGSFVARFADVATAIKALVLSHEKVCGDERSCVLFVKNDGAAARSDDPRAQPANAAEGVDAETVAAPQDD